MNMLKCRLFLALPLLAVLLCGCGSKNPHAPARVSGTVTYKGQPVKGGTVRFHPKEGGIVSANIRSDGTYSATDLPAGEMVVTIETESVNPNKKMPTYGGARAKDKIPAYRPEGVPYSPDSAASAAAYVKIPAKYADPKKSGLAATLNKGENQKDFPLTD